MGELLFWVKRPSFSEVVPLSKVVWPLVWLPLLVLHLSLFQPLPLLLPLNSSLNSTFLVSTILELQFKINWKISTCSTKPLPKKSKMIKLSSWEKLKMAKPSLFRLLEMQMHLRSSKVILSRILELGPQLQISIVLNQEAACGSWNRLKTGKLCLSQHWDQPRHLPSSIWMLTWVAVPTP